MTAKTTKTTLKLKKFSPQLLRAIQGYNLQTFSSDLVAGLTVGVVALPLAMAFAIASGLEPQSGLFTAIVAGFLISAFGGSNVQIGGPAGAFIVVVLGIVTQYGVPTLMVSTLLAGGLLFLMGLTGLGSLIRLIPVSIVIGFTNGIAVLIALSQIKDFLGLNVEATGNFFVKHWQLIQSIPNLNPSAFLLAAGCLAFLFAWPAVAGRLTSKSSQFPRLLKSLPASVMVLAFGTMVATALGLDVETIGGRFGEIPRQLPQLAFPDFSSIDLQNLPGPTLTIALLCAIESLLCARVADSITTQRHDPNQELMAQGIANVASPLFAGMPATGTIARTVTNIRTGAKTPVSGIIHAITLLFIMLLAAPLASMVPLAVLSAILMHVAYNMGEWREFPKLKQYNHIYRIILVSTFTLTVVVDLTVAVQVGLVLAAIFFIYRVSSLTEFTEIGIDESLTDEGIKVYSIYGSLFFGVIGKLDSLIIKTQSECRVLILEMQKTISIDTTALESLEELNRSVKAQGGIVVFAGLNKQAISLFKRSGFMEQLQPEQIQYNLDSAIEFSRSQTRLTDTSKPNTP